MLSCQTAWEKLCKRYEENNAEIFQPRYIIKELKKSRKVSSICQIFLRVREMHLFDTSNELFVRVIITWRIFKSARMSGTQPASVPRNPITTCGYMKTNVIRWNFNIK